MTGTDFYIYIVISLLGVAYPLLLQVIARLDEKYSSENIVGLFDQELEGKAFRYLLYSSLVFIVFWTLKLKPLIQINGLNFFIDNSAAILLSTNTIALVTAFFFLVRKILIYYTPTKFIQYLRIRHSKSKDDFKYFEALSDILLLSIKTQQRNLALTLSEFFYTAFRVEREKNQDKPVIYPDIYYVTVHKSIEELAILKEKRNYSLEYRTAGGIWLLGELQGSKISEKTYSWIWHNLLLITRYAQEDMIVYHWETAHQFYTHSLQRVFEDYDYSSDHLQVKNKEAVENRDSERENFIEFHYALGGLLLYKGMYSCIKRLFSHTNSQPPKYDLLPESMYEILKFYSIVRDPYDRKYNWISNVYPFPKLSGLNADGVIKKWISSYMALLFLRQYTIIPYLITMNPLDYPQAPSTQGEIKDWIDGLDYFKKLVLEHLDNQNLLQALELTFLTPTWCTEENKPYPTDFIDNFKQQLQQAYHTNALTIPLSEHKINKFKESTKQIIERTFKDYDALSNSSDINDDSDKWYVNGQRMLQDKDSFSDNPEVHNMNFDSILASLLSRSIRDGISSTFLFKKSKTYLLKTEDIFPAIEKLNIDEQFVIVCFGLSLDNFIKHLKVQGLTQDKYLDSKLLSYDGSRLVDSSLFILKQSNLPKISTRTIQHELIDKYSLDKISDSVELYASVIDLNNTTEEIFNENRQGKEEDEVKKSVLLNIILSTEIKWRKGIEMIQIVQYSEYRQRGLPNALSEIEQISKGQRNAEAKTGL